jgi:hypothetical protein
VLDNWGNVSRLELNTECLRVRQFSGTIAKFKGRLKHLKFTHFREPLKGSLVNDLGRGLARLSKLETLEMDWEMTNHCDGLRAPQVSQLLSQASPSLKEFVYSVPFDAYFDLAEEDEVIGSGEDHQGNHLPSPLSAGPVNHFSRGPVSVPEGVPIQIISTSLSTSFPTLRVRRGRGGRSTRSSATTTTRDNMDEQQLLSPSSPIASTTQMQVLRRRETRENNWRPSI